MERQSEQTTLTNERWKKLDEIFEVALDLPEPERSAFLNEVCEGDDELRAEVEKLLFLTDNAEADDFMNSGQFQQEAKSFFKKIGVDAAKEADGELPYETIGSYRLLREIGRGGMGAVYLAQREGEFEKQVALKIVKRGLATDDILRRFERERQILANLNHPNIAHLLDGGSTPDGLPYLVMEYVEGVSINYYVRENNSTPNEILKIFKKVCAAVTHAHQKLVVHRDLKPTNILVTADGEPKLLDFGIAKLLAEDGNEQQQTKTFIRAFTPDYASPEQVRGERLSTATDIYSLGIVLYELLTGSRPFSFAGKSYEEIVKTIENNMPVRPSAAIAPTSENRATTQPNAAKSSNNERTVKYLKGDLDNIVLKSLAKEPERRYSSVEQLAEDIERHLSGLPIKARPSTLSYRLQKYIVRHRAGVAAALLVVFSLLTGLSVAVWQAVEARRERASAEKRFNQVRKLANTVIFDYEEQIKRLPGSTAVREKLITDALEYLDNLAQESQNAPDLQRELVAAYRKIGAVQGAAKDGGNLGKTGESLKSYQKALAIQDVLASSKAATVEDKRTLARIYIDLGALMGDSFEDAAAEEKYYTQAVNIFAELQQQSPDDSKANSDLAMGYWHLASHATSKNDWDGAIEKYQKGLQIYEKLYDKDPKNAKYSHNVSLSYKNIGAVMERQKNSENALVLYRKALEIDAKSAAENPNDVEVQLDLSFTHNSIASSLTNIKDYNGAFEHCSKALAIQETVAADANNAFAQNALARTYRRMGDILSYLGKSAEALASYNKSVAKFENIAAADPSNVNKKASVADIYANYGRLLKRIAEIEPPANKRKSLADSLSWQKRGLDVYSAIEAQSPLTPANAEKRDALRNEIQETEAKLESGKE